MLSDTVTDNKVVVADDDADIDEGRLHDLHASEDAALVPIP
jgi:hypothetical protein